MSLTNVEQQRAVQELMSERKYRLLVDHLHAGVVVLGPDTQIIVANEQACRLLGLSDSQMMGKTAADSLWRFVREDETIMPPEEHPVQRVLAMRQPIRDLVIGVDRPATEDRIWLLMNAYPEWDADERVGRIVLIFVDITARKHLEIYREMGREIIRDLNETGDLKETVGRVLDTLRRRTGADAVGLRLQEGEDYPYFDQQGFSRDFLLTENTLLERGQDGAVCRDANGRVSLECTCGLVLAGKTDPANPLFTRGGSCWTNNSFPLADLPPDQDPRVHPRNQCIHQGYASVALIPIRIRSQTEAGESFMDQRIVGLIQINDKRKGRFTPEAIEQLENIASHIGFVLTHKQAMEDIEKTGNLFRSMIDQAPLGAHRYDLMPDDRLVFSGANQAADEILRVNNNQFIGKTIEEAFPTLAATEIPARYRQVARTGAPFSMEQLVYADDKGISGAYELSAFQTGPAKMAVLFRDITEKKKAQAALIASERRFKELVRNSSDSITILDKDGVQIYVSDVVETMLGYKPEELTNIPVIERMIHPEDRLVVTEAFQKIIRDGTAEVQYRHRHKNGSWVHLEAWGTNQLDNPDIRGVVVNVRDISERKLAETEREKLQTQLIQAQKMESVGRLAGGVAHDFNNMLNVILGHTEMALENGALTEPLRADLEAIREAAQRSADLTRQLLAFARKQTVAPKVLDLNGTIGGMLKLLQRLIGEHITLFWKPGHNLWPVRIDPGQIDQILANLCVNARDAISGGGKVAIETENTVVDEDFCRSHDGYLPGNYVMLSVSDTGCGINAEALPHLFEPFFTTKEMGKGTGLGLATIYGVVQQNSGFINVCSEPGRGAQFRIYLPRYLARVTEISESKPKPVERGCETILLVEDELSVLKMTARMLQGMGYNVLAAPTPGEAIRLAREHSGLIDLLITDVVMPEMNGRDLAGNLLSIYPDIRRLFMSGYTADIIASHDVLNEGVHFLQKPFSKETLAMKVREALDEPL